MVGGGGNGDRVVIVGEDGRVEKEVGDLGLVINGYGDVRGDTGIEEEGQSAINGD